METSSKLAESVHGPGLGKQSEVQIMMLSMMMVMSDYDDGHDDGHDVNEDVHDDPDCDNTIAGEPES